MLISSIGLLEPIQNQYHGIIPGCSGNPYRFIHTKCPLSPFRVDLRRVALRDISCGFRSVRPSLFLRLSWGSIHCRCGCQMWLVSRRGGRVV